MPVKPTVQLKSALVKKLERFQKETGISVDYCVEEAVSEWIEAAMPMHLSAHRRHSKSS